jgi:hypothetical protein
MPNQSGEQDEEERREEKVFPLSAKSKAARHILTLPQNSLTIHDDQGATFSSK